MNRSWRDEYFKPLGKNID